jgi:hypothetical protein
MFSHGDEVGEAFFGMEVLLAESGKQVGEDF